MNILISWKESLKNFLLFGFIEDIKAGKPLKSMWRFIKYSFPIWIAFSIVYFIGTELGNEYFLLPLLFRITMIFFIFFAAKPIQLKTHYNKWYYLIYAIFIFLFYYVYRTLAYWILYSTPLNMYPTLQKILGLVFLPIIPEIAPVFLILNPLYPFFICFLFDTGIALQDIGNSFYNAIKMVLYNYPVILVLFFLGFFSYNFVQYGLLLLARDVLESLFPLQSFAISKTKLLFRIGSLLGTIVAYLPYILAVFIFSIYVGFYKNQRKKYPNLYS